MSIKQQNSVIHVTARLFLSFVGTGLGLVTTYMSSQKHPWGVEPPQNPRQVMGGGNGGGEGGGDGGVRHCSLRKEDQRLNLAFTLVETDALFR